MHSHNDEAKFMADTKEAVMVAAALRAGGGVTHGWKAMKAIDGSRC